jgi:predicted dehydrogenase
MKDSGSSVKQKDLISRRGFLDRMAAVGIGATFASLAGQLPASAEAAATGDPEVSSVRGQVGWAIAGLGDYGTTKILPAFASCKNSKVTGLISGTPDKLQKFGKKYSVAADSRYSYDAIPSLKDNDKISVVYVITPNSTHVDFTVKALEAGKHVLCEKPMANSKAECQRMIDAAKAANRKLMVAYRVHFEPNNLKAKELVTSGEIGKVSYGVSDHHRPLVMNLPRDAWRMSKATAGGGSLVDIGIYSINGLLWLLDDSPVEVFGSTYSPANDPRFKEVECNFTGQMRLASGRVVNFSSGYDATKKRVDIFGTKSVITIDPGTAYEGNKVYTSDNAGKLKPFYEGKSELQFSRQLDHFSQAILANTPIRTPGEMGLRDVAIIEALYESAKTNQWIKL